LAGWARSSSAAGDQRGRDDAWDRAQGETLGDTRGWEKKMDTAVGFLSRVAERMGVRERRWDFSLERRRDNTDGFRKIRGIERKLL
jgi:hypothetical protein